MFVVWCSKSETTNFCPVFQLLIICLTKKVHQKKIKNLFITTAGAENDCKKKNTVVPSSLSPASTSQEVWS